MVIQVIGIVGSSKANYSQSNVDFIMNVINDYPKDTIFVTGDAIGIDNIVHTICEKLKRKITVIYSVINEWGNENNGGFKHRNIRIAKMCDKIISIALPLSKESCYHCNRDDHEKTAGCYTGRLNGNYEVKIIG